MYALVFSRRWSRKKIAEVEELHNQIFVRNEFSRTKNFQRIRIINHQNATYIFDEFLDCDLCFPEVLFPKNLN
jgi:hypothetical protein